MNPITYLIVSVIDLYLIVVFAQIISGLLLNFGIINSHSPIVRRISYALDRMVEPALQPIRRYMPNLGGIDISPVVLILGLQFLERLVMYYF